MAEDAKPPAKRDFKIDVLYFIAAVFAVLLIRDFLAGDAHVQTIPYSEFKELVDKGTVNDLVVGPTRITGSYVAPGDKSAQHFSTIRVEPQVADELTRRGIRFSGQPEPGVLLARETLGHDDLTRLAARLEQGATRKRTMAAAE